MDAPQPLRLVHQYAGKRQPRRSGQQAILRRRWLGRRVVLLRRGRPREPEGARPQGAFPTGGGGQSGRDVDVPVEGVIRARRTTERRPDPLGITPANDDVFADQRMVRIREHKDHMIAVTDVAGHWRLGAESNPAGRSEVTVIAV